MYEPKKEDRFSFGVWTVGNRGRDPFGEATRPPMAPLKMVENLSRLGAAAVSFHDNDIIPIDASPSERDRIVGEFKKALQDNGLNICMATTNLFYDPVFKDGAFTANDGQVRACAVNKVMHAIDTGAELGSDLFVFWGGREGSEVDGSKDHVEAIKRYRDAINFLCGYVKDQGYNMRFSLEAKPNEPRGDIYLPTTGNIMAFIATLDHPEMVGTNPEVAHELMANLNACHVVAQAIDHGKLFLMHLNSQKYARFDQDLRFASEDLKGAMFMVHTLETHNFGGYLEFDAHPYRTEDEQGVWEFAKGCMRSYLILRDKSRQFSADPEVQQIQKANAVADSDAAAIASGYSPDKAKALKARTFDTKKIAERGLAYERLDQIANDILMGVR